MDLPLLCELIRKTKNAGLILSTEERNTMNYGCQIVIARFLDHMCSALWASGLWLRYATLQNLIPSFPWIAPPRPPPWRNPRKGRDQILPSGNPEINQSAGLPRS